MNDGTIARRDFLRVVSATSLTTGALSWNDLASARADELRRQGKACILLWMAGGPSQFETFDPKVGHANGGETKAIDTKVPGLQFADNLPELAKVADQLAIVRSVNNREGEHARATYLMHTGYLPTASVQFPAMGAVVVRELPNAECDLPSFVQVGGRPLGGTAGGFLGRSFDPFVVGPGGRAPENSRATTETPRFNQRIDLLDRLQSAAGTDERQEHRKLYANASRMILSPAMQAFDLSLESQAMRDAYGMNAPEVPRGPGPASRTLGAGQFGAGCLLARRLVEAGVTFVEVTLPAWDTHDDNFAKSRSLCQQLDRPFATLLTDLRERGMLEKTLVVWMGEFGRTPNINPRGGRDHFPRAFSVALAGGGIRGGQVIGATDAGGASIVDRPVSEKDLFQTIYKSLGVNTRKENMSPIGRPIKFVDGGTSVDELFA